MKRLIPLSLTMKKYTHLDPYTLVDLNLSPVSSPFQNHPAKQVAPLSMTITFTEQPPLEAPIRFMGTILMFSLLAEWALALGCRPHLNE